MHTLKLCQTTYWKDTFTQILNTVSMKEKRKFIEIINKNCQPFFMESSFHFELSKANRFELKGNNTSTAINNYKNHGEEVFVIKWVLDYWVYAEIRFENTNTFITISIFQGDASDPKKNQLFRAEWDDYNNPEETHPQPHWHITSNLAIEKTFAELVQDEDDGGFAAMVLNEEKSKIIDINKIHFPMNGNWINNGGHIHLIDNDEKIIKWFQGFFSSMKHQLEYAK